MSRLVDSSKYLGRMKELMKAGTAIGGVVPGEHVERFFVSEEVAGWMTEEENNRVLESFWVSLMADNFSRGAVQFVLIEEIQSICARLEMKTRVNDALMALKEGKNIVKGGMLTYMFEEEVGEYRKRWREKGGR